MLAVNLSPFPVLQTERLVLRQISEEDAPELFFLRTDKQVNKFAHKPPPQSLEEVVEYIHKINTTITNNEGINWAITLKTNNTLIGNVGLWRIVKEHHRAEIGYVLHPEFWGKGIMNEAVKAILRFGFETLNLHIIEAGVHTENTNSIRVLETNNFERIGYFKEFFYYDGKFMDNYSYSIINPNHK